MFKLSYTERFDGGYVNEYTQKFNCEYDEAIDQSKKVLSNCNEGSTGCLSFFDDGFWDCVAFFEKKNGKIDLEMA